MARRFITPATQLFLDIARVSDYNKIDIMLVCIGDHFTMGPTRAADAVKAVNPASVVPMHYGTFPVLTGTPEQFERELQKRNVAGEAACPETRRNDFRGRALN